MPRRDQRVRRVSARQNTTDDYCCDQFTYKCPPNDMQLVQSIRGGVRYLLKIHNPPMFDSKQPKNALYLSCRLEVENKPTWSGRRRDGEDSLILLLFAKLVYIAEISHCADRLFVIVNGETNISPIIHVYDMQEMNTETLSLIDSHATI
uniref:Uncharacterized protein n=1 Tax=Timema poppense TaxID=170557 RepID=A0A7R9DN42_TIMPO|nr:unnamed protein product [Timema poppensis]